MGEPIIGDGGNCDYHFAKYELLTNVNLHYCISTSFMFKTFMTKWKPGLTVYVFFRTSLPIKEAYTI